MDFQTLKESALDYTKDQRRALISISLIAIGIAIYFSLSSRSNVVHSAEPIQIESSMTSDSSTSLIFVHVAGEVRKPGLYPMIRGARVNDAISIAGGPTAGADTSQINLARAIVDGEQIYLPSIRERRSISAGKSFNGKININQASVAAFDSLPGIGPVIAERIVKYRREHGPFITLEDIEKVQGVGAKTLARIKDRLTL